MRPCVIRELSRPNEALTYLSYQPPLAPSCLPHTPTLIYTNGCPTEVTVNTGAGPQRHGSSSFSLKTLMKKRKKTTRTMETKTKTKTRTTRTMMMMTTITVPSLLTIVETMIMVTLVMLERGEEDKGCHYHRCKMTVNRYNSVQLCTRSHLRTITGLSGQGCRTGLLLAEFSPSYSVRDEF